MLKASCKSTQDAEGNVWGAGMHQGLIGKVDGDTGEVTVYPIPGAWPIYQYPGIDDLAGKLTRRRQSLDQ